MTLGKKRMFKHISPYEGDRRKQCEDVADKASLKRSGIEANLSMIREAVREHSSHTAILTSHTLDNHRPIVAQTFLHGIQYHCRAPWQAFSARLRYQTLVQGAVAPALAMNFCQSLPDISARAACVHLPIL